MLLPPSIDAQNALPVPPAPPQVEKNTGQQYHTSLSLNDCLDLAVERCGIYFRKIEIRQSHGYELAMLLSSLEAMWQGQRKGSTAALKTNSGSTGSGKRRGKRKQSPSPANGQVSETQCAVLQLHLRL
jgi:hypothetical protein